MASIYRDRRSPYWWMKFRGPAGALVRRSTGIRATDATRDTALRLARTAEQASRLHDLGDEYAAPAELRAAREVLRGVGLLDAPAD